MNVTSPTTFSDYGILLANWLQGQEKQNLGGMDSLKITVQASFINH